MEKGAVGIESPVLENEGNVIDTPPRRQAQSIGLVIFDQEKPGQAQQHLLRRGRVEMRVEPAGRRRLRYG